VGRDGQIRRVRNAKAQDSGEREERPRHVSCRGCAKHCFAAVPHNFCSLRPFIFLNVYLLVVVIK